jgi:hypothetical protein
MNYTPLIDSPWTGMVTPTVIIGTLIAGGIFLAFCYADGEDRTPEFAKKRPKLVWTLTLVPMALIIIGAIVYGNVAESKDQELRVQNLQIIKENLSTKYDMEVDDLTLGELDGADGAGEYFLTSKNESSIASFMAKFDESGEPFIKVDENFTKESVEAMMR